MPITANRQYNDPALGAAFSNLASAFAPPSGSDLAGYATAGAKKEEAARLAALYQMAQSPDFDQSTFDRSNIAVGNYNPTQSFYAQDQNNGTTMRGQDIAASTSITNNTADNEQALMEAILGAATAPVSQDAARPGFNPADFGAAGVPAVPQFDGPRSPMSETEVLGAERLALRDSGTLTDQMLLDSILGDQTPVEVMTPDGPQYSSPGAAVRTGATPYKAPTGATETQNYKTRDGQVGSAYFDPAAKDWFDTSTGERIPAGSVTYSAGLTGDAAGTGLGGPTTANNTVRVNRQAEVTRTLGLLDLYEGVIREDPSAVGMAGAIKGLAQNTLAVSQDLASAFGASVPELQKYSEDLRNGLSSVAPEMFNTNIPEVEFYQGALAYALARTENPSGEVSRQAYERAYDRVTGGALRNSQSAGAAVNAFRQMLDQELLAIDTLGDPSTSRTDTSYQGGDAELPVFNTPEEAAAQPSGTQFKDPQGNIRTVP